VIAEKKRKRISHWNRHICSYVPEWLEVRADVSPGAKVCFARLVRYGGEAGKAWPEVGSLADAIGTGDRQVRRYLAELIEKGLIEIESRQSQGRSNFYYFLDHEWMYAKSLKSSEKSSEGYDGNDKGGMTETTYRGGHIRPHSEEKSGKRIREEESLVEASGFDTHPDPTSQAKLVPNLSGPNCSLPPEAKEQGNAAPTGSAQVANMKAAAEAAGAHTDGVVRARGERQARATKAFQRGSQGAREAQGGEGRRKGGGRARSRKGPARSRESWAQLDALEPVWVGGLRAGWPDVDFAAWGPAERGQIDWLLERYSGEVVEQALRYVVGQWTAIKTRMFKGQGTFPSLRVLVKLHDVLVPEAQRWNEISSVKHEYDAWFAANPNAMVPPQDLGGRYDAVKNEMKALGL
jgi:hypothetical protein